MSLTQSFQYCHRAFSSQYIFIVEKSTPAKLNDFFFFWKFTFPDGLMMQTVKSQLTSHAFKFNQQQQSRSYPTLNCNLNSARNKEKLVCVCIYIYAFFNFPHQFSTQSMCVAQRESASLNVWLLIRHGEIQARPTTTTRERPPSPILQRKDIST